MPYLKIKRDFFILFFVSMLFLSCSRKSGLAQTRLGISDSTITSDSTNIGQTTSALIHLTYEQRQGKILYTKFCSVCHGIEGKGDGFNSFSLDPKPRDLSNVIYMKSLTDEWLGETIHEGGRGVNRSPLMPSWGGRLTKDELMYVVAYVRTFSANDNTQK